MPDETQSNATGRLIARAALAALFIALGVVLILFPNPIAERTGYVALNDHTMGLIDDTLQRDQTTFLVITGIKTSLAMVEGSNVGVGFQLQVGDVVQPAYDYVDFFWRVFLYAFMIMGFYKLLLETNLLLLGLGLAGIGFVLLALSLLVRLPKLDLWMWGRRCVLAGLLFTYVVPLALVSSHALSQRYMEPIKERQAQSIVDLENQLEASVIKFTMLRSQVSLLQPGKTIDDLKTGMLDIANEMGRTFRLSLNSFLYYVLIVLFELIFFPFLSALVIYKFSQFAVGRLLLPPTPSAATPSPTAAPPAEAA